MPNPRRFLRGSRLATALLLIIPLNVAAGTVVVAAQGGFEDVAPDAYYADAVEWARVKGITAGCGEGKYCPDDSVTRGQMAVFLQRVGRLDTLDGSPCNLQSPHKGHLRVEYHAQSAGTANVSCEPDANYTLNVVAAGPNPGVLTDGMGGTSSKIQCGTQCTATYASGQRVQIFAPEDYNRLHPQVFAGFEPSSGCLPLEVGACEVDMTQNRTVTGTWADRAELTLTINWQNAPASDNWERPETISRVVATSPRYLGPSIACWTFNTHGPTNTADGTRPCPGSMAWGDTVTLTAVPGEGATFAGWSGPCQGTALTCELLMDEAKYVSTSFTYS